MKLLQVLVLLSFAVVDVLSRKGKVYVIHYAIHIGPYSDRE